MSESETKVKPMAKIRDLLTHQRALLACVAGFAVMLLQFLFFKYWLLLLVAGFVVGIFYTNLRSGALLASAVTGVSWLTFLIYYGLAFPGSLYTVDIFLSLAVAEGLGFLLVLVTLLIGFIGGLIGGMIGVSLSRLIPWNKIISSA